MGVFLYLFDWNRLSARSGSDRSFTPFANNTHSLLFPLSPLVVALIAWLIWMGDGRKVCLVPPVELLGATTAPAPLLTANLAIQYSSGLGFNSTPLRYGPSQAHINRVKWVSLFPFLGQMRPWWAGAPSSCELDMDVCTLLLYTESCWWEEYHHFDSSLI